MILLEAVQQKYKKVFLRFASERLRRDGVYCYRLFLRVKWGSLLLVQESNLLI